MKSMCQFFVAPPDQSVSALPAPACGLLKLGGYGREARRAQGVTGHKSTIRCKNTQRAGHVSFVTQLEKTASVKLRTTENM